MHIVATVTHLKNACLASGIPQEAIFLKGYSQLDSVDISPSACIFPVQGEGRIHNPPEKARRTAAPNPSLPGYSDAIKGMQYTHFSGTLEYHVVFTAADVDQLERMLVPFFRYLSGNTMSDARVNPPVPLRIPSAPVKLDWVSYSMNGREVVAVILPCDANVLNQKPVIPINLQLTYVIAEGNSDE